MLMRLDMMERRQIIDQARNEERFKLILDTMQDKKFSFFMTLPHLPLL